MLLRLKEIEAQIHVPENIKRTIMDKNEENKDLVLGVRPENVLFSLRREEDYVITEVFAIEKTGSYNIIDIKLGSELIRVRTQPTVVPKVKQNVYIGFDMQAITLFDSENENSIMD
jgi:multiple sugar transport system ATP-binding protein